MLGIVIKKAYNYEMNKGMVIFLIAALVGVGYLYNEKKQAGEEIKIFNYVVLEADPVQARIYQDSLDDTEDEGNFINDKANNVIKNSGADESFKSSVDLEADLN